MSKPPTPGTGTLHFLCGHAGAGKSTLATALAAQHGATLICEDLWLSRLFGDQIHSFDDYLRCARRLRTVVGPLVIDLLASGRNVVLDFPANTRASRAWYRSLFEQAAAAHVLHYVDTSDERCLRQIAQRNANLSEGSRHVTEAEFRHIRSLFEAPEAAEGFTLRVLGESR